MPGNRTTGPEAAARMARDAAALALRREGLDYGTIAARVGFATRAGAYKAVQRSLDRTLAEPAAAVRGLELARCDTLLGAIWARCLEGDLAAINTALRIGERRARLLGLDQADKVDITLRVRLIARALGLDEEAAVAEAELVVAEGRYGRHG